MLHHHHQPSVHVATAPYVSKSPSSTAVVVCHSVVSLPLYSKNTLDVKGLDWSNNPYWLLNELFWKKEFLSATEQKPRASKVIFLYQCSDRLSHSKNVTSLFPLIFLSKHISLYALGSIRWILDIIWPLNQHFKLKNQRNWLNLV